MQGKVKGISVNLPHSAVDAMISMNESTWAFAWTVGHLLIHSTYDIEQTQFRLLVTLRI